MNRPDRRILDDDVGLAEIRRIVPPEDVSDLPVAQGLGAGGRVELKVNSRIKAPSATAR